MLLAYLAAPLAVVIQQGWTTHVDYNFEIFRRSFVHLREGRDLYAAYPAEQVDLFKYSPTFAFLFAPFALLPTLLSLLLWNTANVLSLWYAVRRALPPRNANLVLAIAFIEIVHATQRAQSNSLVTGLMVLGFVLLEERRQLAASVAVVLATCIKIFPVLAVVPAVFHPRRGRMALVMLLVGAVAILLPLVLTSAPLLLSQYRSWYALERLDATAGATGGAAGLYGGVMHWVRLALHVSWPNGPIQLVGAALLLAPLIRTDRWHDRVFRLRVLSSLLLFATIFNPQVEAPSFVIAMTGVGIWYATSSRGLLEHLLLGLTFTIISLGASEALPAGVRAFVIEHKLKILPCLALWLVVQYQLLTSRRARA